MIENNNTVHVFYGFDERFAPFASVSIASLVDHCDDKRRYVIHILHTDLTEETKRKLLTLEKRNVFLRFDSVKEELDSLLSALPIRDYYSPSTYFRLLIGKKYPRINKAVYLDGDTLVKEDIAHLFDIDLGNHWVGGVTDCVVTEIKPCFDYVEKALGIVPKKYINAGMMLINVKAWRENDLLGRFLSLFRFYSFRVAQDQDYLNVLLKGKIKYLPRKWNVECLHKWKIREKDIGLLHFNFSAKPWHDLTSPYALLFWEKAKEVPFAMEIKKEFCYYTSAQLEAEKKVGVNVILACMDEVKNPDNFARKLARVTEEEKELSPEEVPLFLVPKKA